MTIAIQYDAGRVRKVVITTCRQYIPWIAAPLMRLAKTMFEVVTLSYTSGTRGLLVAIRFYVVAAEKQLSFMVSASGREFIQCGFDNLTCRYDVSWIATRHALLAAKGLLRGSQGRCLKWLCCLILQAPVGCRLRYARCCAAVENNRCHCEPCKGEAIQKIP